MNFMKKITKEDNLFFNLLIFLWLIVIIGLTIFLAVSMYQEINFKIE